MSDGESGGAPRNIADFAPDRWFSNRKASSLLLTGFEIAGARFENGTGIAVDLGNCMVILSPGPISYFDPGNLNREFDSANVLWLTPTGARFRETTDRGHILILCPLQVDGQPYHEAEVRQSASAYCGLVAVLCGRNAVYQRVFENVLAADGSTTSGFTPIVENPAVFSPADVSAVRLTTLLSAGQAISVLSGPASNRIQLSLHWFESSLRSNGVDAFLKSWIAFEILTMKRETDIRPLNEALATIYQCSVKEADQEFLVGRLFGLRSRVVHNGELIELHYHVQEYLVALYCDILLHRFDLPTEARARLARKTSEEELSKLLRL